MNVKDLLKSLIVADVDTDGKIILKEVENDTKIDEPLLSEEDEEIKCKMYILRRKLPFFDFRYSTIFNHDEDMRIQHLVDEKERNLSTKSANAKELEKTDPEQAFVLYQAMVDEEFSHNAIPYERLAVNYRKEKRYDDEIEVLKKGILALPKSERYNHAEELLDRLEKTIILREKSKTK